MRKALNHWFKTLSVFCLACGRQRGQGPTVERSLHSDDLVALMLSPVVKVFSRKLDGPLIGFRTGIAKECLSGEGVLRQELGQLDLRFDIEQVGDVNQLL